MTRCVRAVVAIRCAASFVTMVSPLAPAFAGNYTVLYSFNGKGDGARPSGVITDSEGNLYGQTALGGANCPDGDGTHGCGVIFRLDPSGKYTVLTTFEGASNGANGVQPDLYGQGNPASTVGLGNAPPLVLVQHTLYGATPYGGKSDLGVVFSVKTDGSDFTVLHQFGGQDGAVPSGGLAVDPQHNIFGVTWQGGPAYNPANNASGYGVLYEIKADGSFVTLNDFGGATSGYAPSGVFLDQADNVFGGAEMTQLQEGSASYGYVYEYLPSKAAITTLEVFGAIERPIVSGRDSEGNLFGFTQASCDNNPEVVNCGGIFEFKKTPSGFDFIILPGFGPNGGSLPTGLSVGAGDLLTGTTYFGPIELGRNGRPANNGVGTLFQDSSGSISYLFDFPPQQGKVGNHPNGPLVITAQGFVIGATEYGGEHCALAGEQFEKCGVIYRYSP